METQLKCLILDNEPSAQGQLKDVLELMPVRVSVDEQGRPRAALDKIEHDHFDVCFIDLHLDGASRKGAHAIYAGVGVIERVRSHNKSIVLIAYSAALERDNERKSPLFGQCKEAGADAILARTTLFSMSAKSLLELLQPLIAGRRQNALRNVEVEDSLQTRAAVESIGLENIRLLLNKVVPEVGRLRIATIGGGYSGAAVFEVSGSSDGAIQVDTKLIVKVSTSELSLQNELARRPAIGTHFGSLAPKIASATVHTVGDWKAIAFQRIADRVPLGRYIASGPIRGQARGVLERVVSDLFIRPAHEAQKPAAGAGLQGEYRLSLSALAAIDSTLQEMVRALAVVRTQDRKKAEALSDYVNRLALGQAVLVHPGGLLAILHGDLHAENVFVSEHHDPMLIDFERKDVYPRLYDIAALDADLLLRRVQSDKGRLFDFGVIDSLEREVARLTPFSSRTFGAAPATRTELLRSILLDSMAGELVAFTPSEYAYALAFQLLRYLKFPNITLPRRILGVRLLIRLLKVLRVM